MTTLICLTCGAMFDKSKIKSNIYHTDHYLCPLLKNCGNSMIEVDEGLADVVLKLNRVGARTLFSCFGHLPKQNSRPYIVFGSKSYTHTKKLRKSISRLITEGNYEFIAEEIDERKDMELPGTFGITGDLFKFAVTCTNWSNDILQRITQQKNFLELLYSMVDESNKHKFEGCVSFEYEK